jgi:hypothetical protein
MPTYVLAVATRPCMFCGGSAMLALDPDLYDRWLGGEAVQSVWPEWTPGQRELLITGTHPACWDANFSDEAEL